MASVLLSASVERCFVSRMRDFFSSGDCRLWTSSEFWSMRQSFDGLSLIRTLKKSMTCNLLLSKSAIRTLSHWRSITCNFLIFFFIFLFLFKTDNCTYVHMDIATTRPKWPMSQFGENQINQKIFFISSSLFIFLQVKGVKGLLNTKHFRN